MSYKQGQDLRYGEYVVKYISESTNGKIIVDNGGIRMELNKNELNDE
jgi:hypothetical protein